MIFFILCDKTKYDRYQTKLWFKVTKNMLNTVHFVQTFGIVSRYFYDELKHFHKLPAETKEMAIG